jgi:hypothetical protein
LNIALNLALTGLRILLSSGLLARMEELVVQLMDDPRQPGETRKAHNDLRRDYVVARIKQGWPKAWTALLEAAIGMLVYKAAPK